MRKSIQINLFFGALNGYTQYHSGCTEWNVLGNGTAHKTYCHSEFKISVNYASWRIVLPRTPCRRSGALNRSACFDISN